MRNVITDVPVIEPNGLAELRVPEELMSSIAMKSLPFAAVLREIQAASTGAGWRAMGESSLILPTSMEQLRSGPGPVTDKNATWYGQFQFVLDEIDNSTANLVVRGSVKLGPRGAVSDIGSIVLDMRKVFAPKSLRGVEIFEAVAFKLEN